MLKRFTPLIFLFAVVVYGQDVTGEQKKWHKITLEFTDNTTYTETGNPNPFLDRRLNVTFSHTSSGKSYVVPGFFAADGNAAESSANSGNKWHVNFAPDETGTWNYSVSYRQGSNVAVTYPSSPSDGSPGSFNGLSGSFTVGASDKSLPDNRAKGRLMYDGTRYPKFAETNEYFIKGGPDSPENFLAYEDFDGTFFLGTNYIKSYSAHASDWNSGDPSWQSGKGTEIIGAINYLASEGMNCFSFLTMNKNQGDTRDVSPFVENGNNDLIDDYTHYDVSKLAQWEIVFTHAGTKGMFLHFKTQEEENATQLNSGNLGTERRLYYRELIARFGHHLSLNWNMGEENNSQSSSQRITQLQYVADIDPYNHLRVVHSRNDNNEQTEVYNPLLGNASELTGVSLQTLSQATHQRVLFWIQQSTTAGKPWPVSSDETGAGGAADGLAGQRSREFKLYGTYFAGGYGVEYYFPSLQDFTLQDFRSGDKSRIWQQTKYAIDFMNSIPFDEMENADGLISGSGVSAGSNICFAKVNSVYAAYLPDASDDETIDIGSSGDTFSIQWLDPRNGGSLQNGSITTVVASGGDQNIGVPPNNTSSDWVVLLKNTSLDDASISIDNETVAEGDDAVLTISLTGEVSGGFSVDYTTQNGSALSGDDYQAASGTINFSGNAGETQQIMITTLDDAEIEGDETFFINLSDATNGVAIDDGQGQVTLLDDDDEPALSIDDVTVEEGTDAIFTVTLDQDVAGGVSVDYSTSNGSAIAGNDYDAASGTLSFTGTAGEQQTISISTNDDLEVENNEEFTVELSNSSAGVSIDKSEGTATLTDNDIASTISINNATLLEGGLALLTVTLDQPTASGFTIDFTSQGGTAISGSDFTPVSGTLNFVGTGGEAQEITIQTSDDTTVEPNETFQVIISNVVGATVDISDPIGEVTIENNDSASLFVENVSVSEGGTAVLTLSLDNSVSLGFTVDYSTADNTALSGSDYQTTNGMVSFNGILGENASVSVSTIDNFDVENTEDFLVSFANVQGPLAGFIDFDVSQASVEIVDNDTADLTVEDFAVLEGGQAVFSVSLSNGVDGGVTVDYATSDDTATAGSDYTAQNGTLFFNGDAGEVQQISITTISDGVIEPSEQFNLNFSNVSNLSVNLVSTTVTGTIIDGNSASVYINSNTSVEEDDGQATFSVTLSSAVAAPFTVDYRTEDNTAFDGEDYQSSSGILSFAGTAGEVQQLSVPIIDDGAVEPTERYSIIIDNISDNTIEISQATSTGFILDNDGAELSINNVTVSEGVTVQFEVSLNNSVGDPFTVDFTTLPGTAAAGQDFEATSGTLNFNGMAGEIQTVSVNVLDDVISENTETFVVELSNLQGAQVIIAGNRGTATILDDDTPNLVFTDVTVTEGEQARVELRLSAATTTTFTVDYSTTAGTATENQDYTQANGTLSFAGTENEIQTIIVNTVDDMVVESLENFTVQIGNISGALVNLPDNEALVSIRDNEPSSPTIQISEPSVEEGEIAIFEVSLIGNVPGGFTIDFSTQESTALESTDYQASSGSLTFNGNNGEVLEIMIQTIDDLEEETDEQFFVALSNPSSAEVSLANDNAIATILDNDMGLGNLPLVTIANATEEEGRSMTVPISLNMVYDEVLELRISFEDITTTPSDFDPTPLTVLFNSGETEAEIRIPLFEDTEFEEEETFNILVESVVQGTIANPSVTAIGTIENKPEMILYPVPLQENTTPLNITGVGNGTFILSVYEISGKTLISQLIEITANNYLVENVSSLSNGTYVLALQNFGSGREFAKYFVVNK